MTSSDSNIHANATETVFDWAKTIFMTAAVTTELCICVLWREEIWVMKCCNTNTVYEGICQWVASIDARVINVVRWSNSGLFDLSVPGVIQAVSCLWMWDWIRFIVAAWPLLLAPTDLKLPTVSIAHRVPPWICHVSIVQFTQWCPKYHLIICYLWKHFVCVRVKGLLVVWSAAGLS